MEAHIEKNTIQLTIPALSAGVDAMNSIEKSAKDNARIIDALKKQLVSLDNEADIDNFGGPNWAMRCGEIIRAAIEPPEL